MASIDLQSTVGKTITCKAVVCSKDYGTVVEEITVDPPKENEIRVKMMASGICRSDLSVIDDAFDLKLTYPCIMGHEGAGIVESVGPGVTEYKQGDHVVPLWMGNCGSCILCNGTLSNGCLGGTMETLFVLKDGTSRFKRAKDGSVLYHLAAVSTYSQYTVLPLQNAAKIPEDIPWKEAALLGCCVPTSFGSVHEVAKVQPGTTCAVWGLGALGLMAINACANAKAARIIAIDINSDKFDAAKKMGATDCINPITDIKNGLSLQDTIKQMANGIGLEYAFECIGIPKTIETAFECLAPWGKCVVIGVAHRGTKITIAPGDIVYGRTLTGAFFGGLKGRKGVQDLAQQYKEGKIKISDLITGTIKLDQALEGFKMLREGKAIRTVIEF